MYFKLIIGLMCFLKEGQGKLIEDRNLQSVLGMAECLIQF